MEYGITDSEEDYITGTHTLVKKVRLRVRYAPAEYAWDRSAMICIIQIVPDFICTRMEFRLSFWYLKHLLGAATVEVLTEEEKALNDKIKEYVAGFEAAMEDDFNTADAVSSVFELVKFANTTATSENSKEFLQGLYDKIVTLTDILGLIVEKAEELLDEDIENLIAERQAARKAKNFQRADEIRNELLEKGIILEDTREGVKWRRA